jgi:hypothetical protein
MSRGWVDRSRIARRLSRSGTESSFSLDLDVLSDYAKNIKQFHADASVDKRAIAIGLDVEAHWHDAMVSVNDDLKHIVWQNISQIKMWYDFLLSAGTHESPKKILTYMQFPWSFMMDYMSDRSMELTFVNNLDLYYFEKFFLTESKLAEYPDIRYSSIDGSDITSGLVDGQYDLVRATGFGINKTSIKTLESLMDSVAINGTFILSDASDYGVLYFSSETEISSEFLDYGKYICQREDFISYHLPYDVGLVVAKRIA